MNDSLSKMVEPIAEHRGGKDGMCDGPLCRFSNLVDGPCQRRPVNMEDNMDDGMVGIVRERQIK
jgi:hypothetical protein